MFRGGIKCLSRKNEDLKDEVFTYTAAFSFIFMYN